MFFTIYVKNCGRLFTVQIDDEDREKVFAHRWSARFDKRRGKIDRVYMTCGGRRTSLSNFVTGYAVAGHIDGDVLNNKKSNIREGYAVKKNEWIGKTKFIIRSRAHGEKVVEIDETDFDVVAAYTWHINSPSSGESVRTLIRRRAVPLSKLLTGETVGYLNGNPLDNRRANLSPIQKRGRRKSASMAGVYKHGNRFRALACVDGELRHVGMFDTEEEAIEARKKFVDNCAKLTPDCRTKTEAKSC